MQGSKEVISRRSRERLDVLKNKSRGFHLTRPWCAEKGRVGNAIRKVGSSGNGGPHEPVRGVRFSGYTVLEVIKDLIAKE